MNTRRGQATAEFALIATVLFGLLLAVVDLGRAGYTQHALDGGAADLATSLARLSSTNSSGAASKYVPTPLDPTASATAAQIQAALVHAAAVAGGAFSAASPLTATLPFTAGTTTLTNGTVTVVGGPNLTAPTEITVTVTAPFTPAVGLYLRRSVLHLSARASTMTTSGELGL